MVVVLVARNLGQHDARDLGEQVRGLRIRPVDDIHLTAADRVGARSLVLDVEELGAVEEAFVVAIVVRVSLHFGAHAGVEALEPVGAGAETRLVPGLLFGAGGSDDQAVGGELNGQVGVRRLERDDEVVAVLLALLHGRHHRTAVAVGIEVVVLVGVAREHIVHGQRLAVVELHALADLEAPGLGVVGFPALGKTGDRLAVVVQVGQRVVHRDDGGGELIGADRPPGIEAVGVRTALGADPKVAPAPGRRLGRPCPQRGCGARGDAERGRVLHEVAAGYASAFRQAKECSLIVGGGVVRFLVHDSSSDFSEIGVCRPVASPPASMPESGSDLILRARRATPPRKQRCGARSVAHATFSSRGRVRARGGGEHSSHPALGHRRSAGV